MFYRDVETERAEGRREERGGRQGMDQKCRGKRNVVRNEKWLRDMYRELRIRALVSTCPLIQPG